MNWKFWRKAEPLPGPGDEDWEKALVSRVVIDHLAEQKRSRRWGVLFKLLTFAYLIALLVLFWPSDISEGLKSAEKHTALVEVKDDGEDKLGRGGAQRGRLGTRHRAAPVALRAVL